MTDSPFLKGRIGDALREIEQLLNGVIATGSHRFEHQLRHLEGWNGPAGIRQHACDAGFLTIHESRVLRAALTLWPYVPQDETRHKINRVISALHSARHRGGPGGLASFTREQFEADPSLLRVPKPPKGPAGWHHSRRDRPLRTTFALV